MDRIVGIILIALCASCCHVRVAKNVPEYPPLFGEPIYGPDTLYVNGDTLFVYSR